MHPLGQSFRHLHGETVEKEVVAVAIALKQVLGHFTGPFPHGDRLHRQNIGRTAIRSEVLEEVSDAVTVPGTLTGQIEATQLLGPAHVEDTQAVAVSSDGEIAVGDPRCEQLFIQTTGHPLLQDRLRLLIQHRVVLLTALLLGFADLPLPGEQSIAIQVREHLIKCDLTLVQQSRTQEGRRRSRLGRHRLRAFGAHRGLRLLGSVLRG